jgi:(hydroxyamino)benzene mutase
MNDVDSDWMSRHARWMQRLGVLLFLFGLFNGFFVHAQALPGVVLAAHLVALMSGTFLIAVGLLWPKLRLGYRASLIGFSLAAYGFYGGWLLYLVAGVSGVGGMFPLAAGPARGTPSQEGLMGIAFATVAIAMIGFCAFLLWGLRGHARRGAGQ